MRRKPPRGVWRVLEWSRYGSVSLPPPHHTIVPRPWRYYTTHWNKSAGTGARN